MFIVCCMHAYIYMFILYCMHEYTHTYEYITYSFFHVHTIRQLAVYAVTLYIVIDIKMF